MWFAGTLPILPATIGRVYFVERSKDHPKENKQRLFIQRLLHSKAVSLHHLPLAESQRQAREQESYFTVKEKEGFRYTDWGCWHGDPGGRLAGNGNVVWLVWEDIWLLWSILSWKQGQKNLAVIDQALTMWSWLLQMLWFGFLGQLLPRLEVRVLLHRSGHYPLVCSVSTLSHWHWA